MKHNAPPFRNLLQTDLMPDLRKDPIVGRWVIVAEGRAQRPQDFDHPPPVRRTKLCPFCEGHETQTPGEIAAYRSPDTVPDRPGWRVRVVPNKFPALEVGGELQNHSVGMYDMMRGVGVHEVIIESPHHVVSTSDLSEDQLCEVFSIYRDRLLDLKKDPRFKFGMIFKNVGPAAGASLEHIHSQLVVLPIVPINVAEEIAGSLAYFRNRGRCPFCDMMQHELTRQERLVLDLPEFMAFSPFAARFPYETWIVPKTHSSHFEDFQKFKVSELARTLLQVVSKLDTALEFPSYNYIIHTAPFDTHDLNHYHWHIEIIPRLTHTAGFEWGTGFYINPVSPEEAAKVLRTADPEPRKTAERLGSGKDGKKNKL